MQDIIRYAVDADGIATLIIDYPGKTMNVIDGDFMNSLSSCIDRVVADANVKGAILTSAKDAFVAGADLIAMEANLDSMNNDSVEVLFEKCASLSMLVRKMETCGKPFAAAINGVSNSTGITATFSTPNVKSSIQLTSNDGSDIKIANYVHSATANTTFGEGPVDLAGGTGATTTLTNANHSSVKSGIVTLSSTKGAITTASGNTTIFTTATQASTFDNVQGISIASQSGASAALSVIDSALTQVNISRANLGALINRFETSISSQSNSIMNLSESRSRILDADYAKETSLLAKSMIIQQAATAMLGQANQNPMLVLHLLK